MKLVPVSNDSPTDYKAGVSVSNGYLCREPRYRYLFYKVTGVEPDSPVTFESSLKTRLRKPFSGKLPGWEVLQDRGWVRAQRDEPLHEEQLVRRRIHVHEPPITAARIRVVYQDDDLVVVCKPGTMPVHRTGVYELNHLQGMMSYHYPKLGQVFPVHRLDLLTTGVCILAKSLESVHRIV
eukprot:RCo013252